jgi:putative alpha-1,2-mannosidase
VKRFQVKNAEIKRVSATEIEGFADSYTNDWDEYKLHFVIRFSKPFKQFNGWTGDRISRSISKVNGSGEIGAFVTFSTSENEVILVQTGLSLVGLDGARLNLEKELDPIKWDFDLTWERARSRWSDILNRIQVEGGSETDKVKFYTNLYRSYCAKQTWNDVDGRYVDPREQIQQLPEGVDIYGGDAFWNTYWNVNGPCTGKAHSSHPLICLINPYKFPVLQYFQNQPPRSAPLMLEQEHIQRPFFTFKKI